MLDPKQRAAMSLYIRGIEVLEEPVERNPEAVCEYVSDCMDLLWQFMSPQLRDELNLGRR